MGLLLGYENQKAEGEGSGASIFGNEEEVGWAGPIKVPNQLSDEEVADAMREYALHDPSSDVYQRNNRTGYHAEQRKEDEEEEEEEAEEEEEVNGGGKRKTKRKTKRKRKKGRKTKRERKKRRKPKRKRKKTRMKSRNKKRKSHKKRKTRRKHTLTGGLNKCNAPHIENSDEFCRNHAGIGGAENNEFTICNTNTGECVKPPPPVVDGNRQ